MARLVPLRSRLVRARAGDDNSSNLSTLDKKKELLALQLLLLMLCSLWYNMLVEHKSCGPWAEQCSTGGHSLAGYRCNN